MVREAVVSINYPELSLLKVSTAALPLSLAASFLPSTNKPSRGSRGLNQKRCFFLLFAAFFSLCALAPFARYVGLESLQL